MNIKDIARLAGVGVSTVSRVINNHPDVKQDTREKILEIIKEYNYIPNNGARMLKQNHTRYIGVLERVWKLLQISHFNQIKTEARHMNPK